MQDYTAALSRLKEDPFSGGYFFSLHTIFANLGISVALTECDFLPKIKRYIEQFVVNLGNHFPHCRALTLLGYLNLRNYEPSNTIAAIMELAECFNTRDYPMGTSVSETNRWRLALLAFLCRKDLLIRLPSGRGYYGKPIITAILPGAIDHVWDEFGPPHLPLWGANSLHGTSNLSHLSKQASVLPFSITLMIFM